MPHLESRTQRVRNTRLIEERNRAARRMVWWACAGVLGVALYVLARGTEWRYDGRMVAVGAATVTLVVTAAVGLVTEGLIALEPIDHDELHTQRSYADTDAPPTRLIPRDENVTLVVDPAIWQAGEFAMVAARLRRAGWKWSREVINGGRREQSLANITGRYPAIRDEMERVEVIERDGSGYRVTALGKAYFSPTPDGEPPQTV